MFLNRTIQLTLSQNPILPLYQLSIIRPSRFPNVLIAKSTVVVPKRTLIGFGVKHKFKDEDQWIRRRIGNREIVGFGVNGQPEYVDRQDYPFPSLRWKPSYPEIQALREKERGDWRLLTIEEKKAIYRANFRQTFAEFLAPTGDWMGIVGITLILTSVGLWIYILQKLYIYSRHDRINSLHPSNQQQQLVRILQLRQNPVTGLSSRWDYEKKKWKSKPWYIPWEDPFTAIVECEEDQN